MEFELVAMVTFHFKSDNEKLLKAVLCAGLYPNVAKLVPKGPKRPPQLHTKQDRKVEFHLKSVNSKRRTFTGRFLVYNTKVKSSSVSAAHRLCGPATDNECPPHPTTPLTGVHSRQYSRRTFPTAVLRWRHHQ